MPDPSITVEEGCTLIEALSAIHPEAKKNSLRRMISQGRTRIDGIRGEHPRQRVGPRGNYRRPLTPRWGRTPQATCQHTRANGPLF